jgi:hypothetical protein
MACTLVDQNECRKEWKQKKVKKCNKALLQAKRDKAEAQLALSKASKDYYASRKRFKAALETVRISPRLIDEY